MAVRKRTRQWFAFQSRTVAKSDGVNDAWNVTSVSLAKDNSGNPYLIANELICSSIGHFLRLPVPPFALMGRSRTKGMFASLKFGRGEAQPNDVIPAEVFKHHPFICTGILAFDILIANADRHSGNILVDSPVAPKKVCVIDHDRALFGCLGGDGKKRLSALIDRLGISGGTRTKENRHCLLDVISSCVHFSEWRDRITTIPYWLLKEVCLEAAPIFVTKKEALAAADFLKYRRDNLDTIILNNKPEFPLIQDWGIVL